VPTINLKAGEKTRIIHKFSNSLATEYTFSVQPKNPGETVSGEVEISGSSWVFPKAPVRQPLQDDNVVAKGMWDTFYSVYVTPKSDVTVSLAGGSLNSRFAYVIAAIVLVAVIAALIPFILS